MEMLEEQLAALKDDVERTPSTHKHRKYVLKYSHMLLRQSRQN